MFWERAVLPSLRLYEIDLAPPGSSAQSPPPYTFSESLRHIEFGSVFVEYAASAVIATRIPQLTLSSRTGRIIAIYQVPVGVTANGSGVFTWARGSAAYSLLTGVDQFGAMPFDSPVQPFDVLELATVNADVGDTLQGATLRFWASDSLVNLTV